MWCGPVFVCVPVCYKPVFSENGKTSHKQCTARYPGRRFSNAKVLGPIPMASRLMELPNTCKVGKIRSFMTKYPSSRRRHKAHFKIFGSESYVSLDPVKPGTLIFVRSLTVVNTIVGVIYYGITSEWDVFIIVEISDNISATARGRDI